MEENEIEFYVMFWDDKNQDYVFKTFEIVEESDDFCFLNFGETSSLMLKKYQTQFAKKIFETQNNIYNFVNTNYEELLKDLEKVRNDKNILKQIKSELQNSFENALKDCSQKLFKDLGFVMIITKDQEKIEISNREHPILNKLFETSISNLTETMKQKREKTNDATKLSDLISAYSLIKSTYQKASKNNQKDTNLWINKNFNKFYDDKTNLNNKQ